MKAKTKTLLATACVGMSSLMLSCTKEKQILPNVQQQEQALTTERARIAGDSKPTEKITADIRGIIQYSPDGKTLTVKFNAVGSKGYIAEAVTWDFGDGETSDDLSPLHTYPTVKSYNATASVTLKELSTGSIISPINAQCTVINPIPASDFEIIPVAPGQSCDVYGIAKVQTAKNYLWDFGNGGLGNPFNAGYNAVYTGYRKGGTYHVKLTVTNPTGHNSTSSKIISIPFDLVANFYQAPSPLPYFHNSSQNAVSSTWDFGDGTAPVTDNNDTVEHKYATPGIYNVTLTVKDINGNTKSKTLAIRAF